jgi:antitoxin ParD1/3/4
MNIYLPAPLEQFVNAQIARGLYGSVSEYVSALIRRDEKDKAEKLLEALLLEGFANQDVSLTSEHWGTMRDEALAAVHASKKAP